MPAMGPFSVWRFSGDRPAEAAVPASPIPQLLSTGYRQPSGLRLAPAARADHSVQQTERAHSVPSPRATIFLAATNAVIMSW